MACSLSNISSLTPADQPCLLPSLLISALPLAMADRRALMFVPVRISSPSLADLIRPLPLASTRHTKGRNSGDLSCSSIRAFSSALSSGLFPACSLAPGPKATGSDVTPSPLWRERFPLSQLAVQAQLVWLLLPLQRAALNFLSVSLGSRRCFPPSCLLWVLSAVPQKGSLRIPRNSVLLSPVFLL
jgi:hypothetical protein